jgi:hypothetical protein
VWLQGELRAQDCPPSACLHGSKYAARDTANFRCYPGTCSSTIQVGMPYHLCGWGCRIRPLPTWHGCRIKPAVDMIVPRVFARHHIEDVPPRQPTPTTPTCLLHPPVIHVLLHRRLTTAPTHIHIPSHKHSIRSPRAIWPCSTGVRRVPTASRCHLLCPYHSNVRGGVCRRFHSRPGCAAGAEPLSAPTSLLPAQVPRSAGTWVGGVCVGHI